MYLSLVWANLKRRKIRTILTLLSIVVAFMLFGLLMCIKQALTMGVSIAGQERLIVRHKVSLIQLLPHSYLARIEKIPGVKLAAHQTWTGAYYQDPKKFQVMVSPVDPEAFLAVVPEIGLPEDQKKAWLATRTGAIVGKRTADEFKFKIGDKIPLYNPFYTQNGNRTWELDVVGIFDKKEQNADDMSVFFRYDYFDEARDSQKGMVGWYSVKVTDKNQAEAVARKIDAEFENSPYETKTETEGAFVQGFAQQLGNITLIVASILAAVFFTILLVTGNTMAQAVRERTGELGVLKAIGFTSRQVMGMVLLESCVLSITGGLIGLGFSWLMALGGDPTGKFLPMFYFPKSAFATGTALTVALGVITGVLPAIQAMKLRTADALRRM